MSRKNNKKFPLNKNKRDANAIYNSDSDDEMLIQTMKLNTINKKNKTKKLDREENKTDSDSELDSELSSELNSELSSELSSESELGLEPKLKSELSESLIEVKIKKFKKTTKNSNEIFKELIKKQLPDTPTQWKLNINDMKRICKYIDTSIFDKDNCCIWNGYITNMNNSNKGTYVNFYFRNKKVALHRLLYSNFVAPLDSSEYLKFNCDNKGICCNINHYEKYKYSKNNNVKKESKHKEQKKEIKEISIISGSNDPDNLIINFD